MCNLVSVSCYQCFYGCSHSSFGAENISNIGSSVTGVFLVTLLSSSDLKLHIFIFSKKGMHCKEAFIYKYVCVYIHIKHFSVPPRYSQALF